MMKDAMNLGEGSLEQQLIRVLDNKQRMFELKLKDRMKEHALTFDVY
jgi:hypothetical protein